ncbi:DnaJ protein, putative [Hepatocystis sp. ex Piliocolobus tephrosceles]|nr:DnaJ protein, putative [Hepatocystis sp. ex Piliocolobus tephrosceles]
MENKKKVDLYEILGVKKTASIKEITRAYRILALSYHPDKFLANSKRKVNDEQKKNEKNQKKTNKSDAKKASSKEENANENTTNQIGEINTLEECKELFLQIQKAYEILRDPEKRKNYDAFGLEGDFDEFKNFIDPKLFHSRIKAEDILNYEKNYKNSKDEKEDLVQYYEKFNGNLKHILEYIPFSDETDLSRYLDIFEQLFKTKELKKTSEYEKSLKSINTIIEKYKNIIKKDNQKSKKRKREQSAPIDDLVLAIQNNEAKRNLKINSIISNIESKYNSKHKKKKIKEPTEEELEAISKKLEANKENNKKLKKMKTG